LVGGVIVLLVVQNLLEKKARDPAVTVSAGTQTFGIDPARPSQRNAGMARRTSGELIGGKCMSKLTVSASRLIPAPARQEYDLIADYRNGHPRILPKPYFVSLDVEKGGYGTGTVITFQIQLMGRIQSFHSTIVPFTKKTSINWLPSPKNKLHSCFHADSISSQMEAETWMSNSEN
jgi:hypothetical protein